MNNMDSYIEKLRHPKWQRVRCEVMQRADFTCEVCGSKENCLTIHHGMYIYKTEPWDYPQDTLWCICESCHKSAQEKFRDIKLAIAKISPREYDVVLAKLNFSGVTAEDTAIYKKLVAEMPEIDEVSVESKI